MFTGLVEEMGRLVSLDPSRGVLRISAAVVTEGTRTGDSVAVNGVCLTVTDVKPTEIAFDVSATTQKRTSLNSRGLRPGCRVNLERAVRADGRFGGHFVTGHVDAVARVIDVEKLAGHVRMEFVLPDEIRSMVAARGSVTIDGVSLTVAETRSRSFVVAVIPETLARTTLGSRRAGDDVHLEADVLARYAARLLTVGDDVRRSGHEMR